MATIEHVEAHVGIQAEDVDCRHAGFGPNPDPAGILLVAISDRRDDGSRWIIAHVPAGRVGSASADIPRAGDSSATGCPWMMCRETPAEISRRRNHGH
jgi:hypothetical protein